jgi:hypothetical protein
VTYQTRLPLQGRSFTWSNKRLTPTFSRLDRALLSSYWALGLTHTLCDLPNTTSDHAPSLLFIKPIVCPTKRCFRFENFWLNEEIKDIISQAWSSVTYSSNPTQNLKNRLWSTQKALSLWAKQKFKNKNIYLVRSKEVIRLLDLAEERRVLNIEEFGLRIALKEHVYILTRDIEIKWKQRSRCAWLKAGYNNTKYFHAVANTRHNKNVSLRLTRMDDSCCTEAEMHDIAFNYFRGILGSEQQINSIRHNR